MLSDSNEGDICLALGGLRRTLPTLRIPPVGGRTGVLPARRNLLCC